MKGEIKMENTHSTFLVLKIREDKNPKGETEITVSKGFDTLTDAKNYKDAKDLMERLSPRNTWRHTQYKIQQIFYKSFVQDEKKSWKDLVSA